MVFLFQLIVLTTAHLSFIRLLLPFSFLWYGAMHQEYANDEYASLEKPFGKKKKKKKNSLVFS